ncbi:S24/S26 family peptidase [Pedobacter antarcticus]|uniref:S24/S26 family peptidase n=1 Tax=Pedobacter antarcticus TaxID=34086 RepID=UPI001C57026C|nr:S24/S26 family peptidase [Pedobacter antarcticus]
MLNKDRITIPNKLLFEQVLSYIKQGKYVTIRVKGTSMLPFLKEGNRVSLKSFHAGELTKGIIVLANVHGQMILHRVVRYNNTTIYLAGDGNVSEHEVVSYGDVVATAFSVYRGETEVKLNQRWLRYLGQVWYWIRPVRRVARKLF